MAAFSSLEHAVLGEAEAEQHWHVRRREAAIPSPAFTIAISREAGAAGPAVAHEVGRRLAWPVYEHELLEKIARDHNLRVRLLESLDERRQSWLTDCLNNFGQQTILGETGFVHYLRQTLLALGAHGCCVILGRGAAQLLPAATTLRIRLAGAFENRVAYAMRSRKLSKDEAEKWVEATDRERAGFIKEHFLKDPADPRLYDLILNTSRWPVMQCADLIVDALGRLMSFAASGTQSTD